MDKTVVGILSFVAGAAIGGGITWFIMERKNEQRRIEMDHEYRDNLAKAKKEILKERSQDEKNPGKESTKKVSKKEVKHYTELATNLSYVSDDDDEKEEECPLPPIVNYDKPTANLPDPYNISPEEYKNNTEYEKEYLSLYSDGSCYDENDELVDSLTVLVGNKWDTYPDIERDMVAYVRNEKQMCDYEIDFFPCAGPGDYEG